MIKLPTVRESHGKSDTSQKIACVQHKADMTSSHMAYTEGHTFERDTMRAPMPTLGNIQRATFSYLHAAGCSLRCRYEATRMEKL